MQSYTDDSGGDGGATTRPRSLPAGTQGARRGWDVFRWWNRRAHYYLGLYLLFFVWLFLFTGLLLNHPRWKFAEFWENRRQSSFERELQAPTLGARPQGDLMRAREILAQLGLRGGIDWTTSREDPSRLEFRVSRPGHIYEIAADLTRKRAAVKQIALNGWGVMRILHTFTGVRLDDARNTRDWTLTRIWAWTMDTVAVGLILTVVSSYVMWLELPRKKWPGSAALALGVLSCALFCAGLRWLF